MMQLKPLAVVFGLLIAISGAARADIQFTGTSSGAFSPAIAGLTFAGSGISALVPVGGGASLSNLGTFTLQPTCSGQNCTQTISSNFTLTLTFSAPTGIGNQLFSAAIAGTAKRSGKSGNFNGTATIDFDNTVHTISYTTATGSGSFGLSVNNPSTLVVSGSTVATATVTGQISGLTYTTTTVTPPTAHVPEPASVLLTGAVLALVGVGLRRRIKA